MDVDAARIRAAGAIASVAVGLLLLGSVFLTNDLVTGLVGILSISIGVAAWIGN